VQRGKRIAATTPKMKKLRNMRYAVREGFGGEEGVGKGDVVFSCRRVRGCRN
jgi:hypothetical protein